jgi:hypothetical protein
MSRESAHRLRNRPGASLFAHLWDLALAPQMPERPLVAGEGHSRPLGDGALVRLLGTLCRVGKRRFRSHGVHACDGRGG